MSLRLVASTFSAVVVFCSSVIAGPFDAHVGTYKGSGVEYSNAVYRYSQTVKLEASSMVSTSTLPGYFSTREAVSFRDDGKLSGTGRLLGYPITWTVRGKWRQEGEVIKGSSTTFYSDGTLSFAKFSLRLKEGKLVGSSSGYTSDGTPATSSFRAKLKQ